MNFITAHQAAVKAGIKQSDEKMSAEIENISKSIRELISSVQSLIEDEINFRNHTIIIEKADEFLYDNDDDINFSDLYDIIEKLEDFDNDNPNNNSVIDSLDSLLQFYVVKVRSMYDKLTTFLEHHGYTCTFHSKTKGSINDFKFTYTISWAKA